MKRTRWIAVGLALLLLLVAVGAALSLWLLAEEAELAPPLEPTVRAAVEDWTAPASPPPRAAEHPRAAPAPAAPEATPRRSPEPPQLCPATLFVETPEGEPVVGAVSLHGGRGWVQLGPDGEADWPTRRCDRSVDVHVRPGIREGRPEIYAVPFEDTDAVTLVLHPLAEAWVRPVDEAGRPIEAEVRPGVEQDDGWVHLQRGSPSMRVNVRVPGERGGEIEVPLDGGEHDVVVPRDRHVDVTLLCDQCPGYLSCSASQHVQGPACVGEGTAYRCLCPSQGDAALILRSPSALLDWQEEAQVLALIPEGEDRVHVDVRGELGFVRAQVEVPAGSSVLVHVGRPGGDRNQRQYVEETDGRVEIDGLLPGEWELILTKLTVHSRADERRVETRIPFQLASGEVLDLGVLTP